MKMNEPAQYELWIDLPTSVNDVDSYLNLRDCEVLNSDFVGQINNPNFNRWQVLVELPTPRKDIHGYLEGRIKCRLVASFEKKETVQ
ncbi:MAG: hypothetical protein AABX99_00500 [Nanoarchaeota archaeon]